MNAEHMENILLQDTRLPAATNLETYLADSIVDDPTDIDVISPLYVHRILLIEEDSV